MKSLVARIRTLLGTEGMPRIGWLFAAQTLVTELGFFSLFPILGILLTQRHGWHLEDVALPVAIFTVAVRCAFLIAPLLANGEPKRWMAGGLVMTSCAFFCLPFVEARWLVIVLLAFAGMGISIYLTLSRAWIAEETGDSGRSIAAYSVLNLALNVSASVGPLIGGFLMSRSQAQAVFWLGAAGYLIAAISVTLFVPRKRPTVTQEARKLGVREMLRLTLGHRRFRRFAVASAAGWCLYAQLFATLPLYFAVRHGSSAAMGTLFTINALIVVVFQLPCSAIISRAVTRRGMSFEKVLGVGYALFSIAFLVLAASDARLVVMYCAVAVFTFGELVFAPVCNSLVADIGKSGEHVAFFSARSVADAIGESIGVYVGMRVLTALLAGGHGDVYWIFASSLAIAASAFAFGALRSTERSP